MNVNDSLSNTLSFYENLEPFSDEDIIESKKLMEIYQNMLIAQNGAAISFLGTSALSFATIVSAIKSPMCLTALVPITAASTYKCVSDISQIMKKIHSVQYTRDEYLEANEAHTVTEATLRAINVEIKFGK